MNTRTVITKRSLVKFHGDSSSDDVRLTLDSDTVKIDGYLKIVLKLIPSEIITAYVTIHTFVQHGPASYLIFSRWILFLMCTFLTPIYLYKLYNVKLISQMILSTIVFMCWATIIGSPLDYFFNDSKYLGVFITLLACLLSPIIYVKENKKTSK